MKRAVLAIDGGNTKSIAVVATTDGVVLGHGLGGCGDIYGAPSEEDALANLSAIATTALAEARVDAAEISAMVASVAGADWPEDFELFERELVQRLGLSCPRLVENDGLGPLRLGDPSGTGVAVVLGTGVAIGARGPDGKTWNSSFWPAILMTTPGQRALEAVYRCELGLGPPTALTERLLSYFGVADVEALLHGFTQRIGRFPPILKQQIGVMLLEEDATGDAVARDIVGRYASDVAEYALVAAKKAGLGGRFTLVLTGGLLSNRGSSLAATLASRVRDSAAGAQPVLPAVAPVGGSVLEAIALSNGGDVTKDVHQRVLVDPALQALGMTPRPPWAALHV
jgi:N-acetylglucosamine kinase-like BadF-type ATPase